MTKIILMVAMLFPVVVLAQSAPLETKVNAAARMGGETTEVCVATASATTVPTTALAWRKAIELQNLGPNAIYCTVDGSTPTNTGSNGRKIATDTVWSLDVGPDVVVKCIAATALQATPACTMVTELR